MENAGKLTVADGLVTMRDGSFQMIADGVLNHSHSFHEVAWDYGRFGPNVTDMDDINQPFPHANYKCLFRCSCGAEGIKSSYGLI